MTSVAGACICFSVAWDSGLKPDTGRVSHLVSSGPSFICTLNELLELVACLGSKRKGRRSHVTETACVWKRVFPSTAEDGLKELRRERDEQ